MADRVPFSALVTGAASGIGRATAKALLARGYRVTFLDCDGKALEKAVGGERRREVRTAVCDVVDAAALTQCFDEHVEAFGSLEVVVNSAGVMGNGKQGAENARRTVGVNLTAVVDATRLAIERMEGGGAVINLASTGGIWPMGEGAEVYAATKAGVIHFTRSIAANAAARRRIRVMTLCPTFTRHTGMGDAIARLGGDSQYASAPQVPLEEVVAGALALLDAGAPGDALVVTPGRLDRWRFADERPSTKRAAARAPPPRALPEHALPAVARTRRAVVVTELSSDFARATRVVEEPLPTTLGGSKVLVTRVYAGVNASDVNFSSGRYFGRSARSKLPFGAGFESVGYVSAAGPEAMAAGVRVGHLVSTMEYGAFSTHGVVDARTLLPCRSLAPESVALLTSGLTAKLALEQTARLRRVGEKGERRKVVLVTAAAGGTGQFAVQLARRMGHEVVATCGSDAKAALVRRLGATLAINYRTSDVRTVLRERYPAGVDVVFESVGGAMFDAAVACLAQGGVVVVIGMMSAYLKEGGDERGWASSVHKGFPEKLLWVGGRCEGFFLLHHGRRFRKALLELNAMDDLVVAVDAREWKGVEEVSEAVRWLQSGKSMGKVVVRVGEAPVVGGEAKL